MTTRQSIARAVAGVKRQIGSLGRIVNPYAHEDAMDRLLGRDTPAIARVLGLARRTIQQWRDRYDADHRGPGRTLALAARAAVDLGRSVGDALAPVAAILDEFEADIAFRSRATGERHELLEACADAMREQAEAVQEALAADADQRVTPSELATIKRRCADARAAIDDVERAAEARVATGPTLAAGGLR